VGEGLAAKGQLVRIKHYWSWSHTALPQRREIIIYCVLAIINRDNEKPPLINVYLYFSVKNKKIL